MPLNTSPVPKHVLQIAGHYARSSRPGREMKTEIFVRRSRVEAPPAEVYAWYALPDALERLTPPEEHVKVLERTGGIESGARVVIQFGRWPFRRRWVAEHQDYQEGHYFSDIQISSPFANEIKPLPGQRWQ